MCNNPHHHHHEESQMDAAEKKLMHRRNILQGLAAGGALTVAGTALTGCSTNSVTGEKQLAFVPDSQLSQMAAASWAEAKSSIPQSTDPRYTTKLRDIGNRISHGANKGSEAWDYAVFDKDTRNAFVLPGNRVGFYKGMMDFTDNDDQIAAIMGHEVGHVTGRHSAERVSQQLLGQVAVTGGTVLAGSQLAKRCRSQAEARIAGRTSIPQSELSAIQQAYQQCTTGAHRNTQYLNAALGMGFTVGVLLPFSRKHELQSDLLGAKYMQKAGYDPQQAVKLWEKMAAERTSSTPNWLSTHPDPSYRARQLHNFIACQERLGSQGWEGRTLKDDLDACDV